MSPNATVPAIEGCTTRNLFRREVVPEVGFEPTCPCGHGILSAARKPVPPLRRSGHILRVSTFHRQRCLETRRLPAGQLR